MSLIAVPFPPHARHYPRIRPLGVRAISGGGWETLSQQEQQQGNKVAKPRGRPAYSDY